MMAVLELRERVSYLYACGTIIWIATDHRSGLAKVLASVPIVNLIQYAIILSSSVGHGGVITQSAPNSREQS
jgi:hypothetical protein